MELLKLTRNEFRQAVIDTIRHPKYLDAENEFFARPINAYTSALAKTCRGNELEAVSAVHAAFNAYVETGRKLQTAVYEKEESKSEDVDAHILKIRELHAACEKTLPFLMLARDDLHKELRELVLGQLETINRAYHPDLRGEFFYHIDPETSWLKKR